MASFLANLQLRYNFMRIPDRASLFASRLLMMKKCASAATFCRVGVQFCWLQLLLIFNLLSSKIYLCSTVFYEYKNFSPHDEKAWLEAPEPEPKDPNNQSVSSASRASFSGSFTNFQKSPASSASLTASSIAFMASSYFRCRSATFTGFFRSSWAWAIISKKIFVYSKTVFLSDLQEGFQPTR